MSTLEDHRSRATEDEVRTARYDAHREEKRTIGARARAEAQLQEAFERDLISLPALEDRLAAVNKATSAADIDAALIDVPRLSEVEETPTSTAVAVKDVPRSGWAVAILGGSARKGRWRVPGRLQAVSVLGGCEIDLSEAELGPLTHIHCISIMGGVEIKVPPGVRVESNGIGILGGFESAADGRGRGPVVRISGVAIMGGVEIKTVHPPGG